MAQTEKDDERGGARSFARFLEQLGHGDALEDLSNAQHELGNALQDVALDLGGGAKVKGELKVTFKYTCDSRGNVGVDWDVTTKKPKRKRATAQAWVNKAGNLVFEPPRQQKLPLHEVKERRELRDVDEGDAPAMREV